MSEQTLPERINSLISTVERAMNAAHLMRLQEQQMMHVLERHPATYPCPENRDLWQHIAETSRQHLVGPLFFAWVGAGLLSNDAEARNLCDQYWDLDRERIDRMREAAIQAKELAPLLVTRGLDASGVVLVADCFEGRMGAGETRRLSPEWDRVRVELKNLALEAGGQENCQPLVDNEDLTRTDQRILKLLELEGPLQRYKIWRRVSPTSKTDGYIGQRLAHLVKLGLLQHNNGEGYSCKVV